MKRALVTLCSVALITFSAAPQGHAITPEQEKRVIVGFKQKVDEQVIEEANGELHRELKQAAAASITVPVSEIAELREDPAVKYVEEDMIVTASGQVQDYGIVNTKAPAAWKHGYTGKGVKVAVIDTGIAAHDDLRIAGGVSTVSYTSSFSDDNGHGTYTAGIVGALNNEIGTVGVAPEASLYAVKALGADGEGYLSDVLAGLEWSIANKMDIINLSLGSNVGSVALRTTIDKAYNNGILVVAAAGNDGSADGSGDTVDYPARYESAISVAAVDENNERASFSSTGPSVEIAAPGENVYGTYLNNEYTNASGTSIASPFVAGNLALLKQANPTLSAAELRKVLQQTALDLGVKGRDDWYGYGLLQAPAAASISFLETKGVLDEPTNGATVSGTTTVRGWMLDGSGVAKVDVLVDGVLHGTAAYGQARSDVQRVYPAYNNGNAGYTYALDTTKLANGNHTISIQATSTTGNITTLPAHTVKVSNTVLETKGSLDAPANGTTISGTTTVRGWALDGSGVAKVDVLIDGVLQGNASYGQARPDVQRVYPAYNNDSAGYMYALDTTKLTNGSHTLSVRVTSTGGAVTTLPAHTVKVSNTVLETKGSLDAPANGTTISGTTTVRGWALDGSGVAKVDVLIDGVLQGNAAYGQARPDVQRVYPAYNNDSAGYMYALDTTKLTNGSHTLSIRVTSTSGKITTLPTHTVKISNAVLETKGVLDTPANGTTISGTTTVRGWVLDGSGVAKVEVLIDGTIHGTAAYGQARPDVQRVYPAYNNGNAGYTYTLDTTKLTNGKHTISIRVTSLAGHVTTVSTYTVTASNS